MLKIDFLNGLTNIKPHISCISKTNTTDSNAQTKALPTFCMNDSQVKLPIKYNKISEFELPHNLKASYYKLDNGQKVIIIPKSGETVVKTYVNTGSMNEPDKVRGISHYIEHNLFNGSDGLEPGEFFKTVDKMGANTNASTGFAQTNYYISSNLLKDDDLEKKIRIHAAMMQTPKFASEMLEKEKAIVNSEINMYQGFADNIAMNSTLKTLFNIQSASNDLIAGTTENINNITKEDVVDYYNNNYYPANMVTVVTGEVDPEKTIQLIAKYFNSTNKTTHQRKFETLTPIDRTVRQDIECDKTNSTNILLGFKGPQNTDTKSIICLELINDILSNYATGRFDKALKTYNTSANLSMETLSGNPNDNCAILINSKTTEENQQKVLQEIFNQVHSLTTDTNFDTELSAAKKAKINANALDYESSKNVNSIIGNAMLYGNIENVTNYENIVSSITKEDIIKTAKEYLDLNKTVVTVVHPKLEKNISFTGNNNKQAINQQDIIRYRMPNNVEFITNNSKTNLATMNINFNSQTLGKFNPAAQYVLKYILNEGSAYRNKIDYNKSLQDDAIEMDFANNTSGIYAFTRFNPADTNKAIKSMYEVLYNPRFTAETFEYAKNKVQNDLLQKEKNANDKLNKEIYANLPQGQTKEDILEGLKTLTINEVMRLYQTIMTNSQASITATAPFKKNPQCLDIFFNEISKMYPVRPYKPYKFDLYQPTTETKVLTDTDTKPQADIIEAYKFRLDGNLKDIVAIDLLNIILGESTSSRLFNDLREKQHLAYHVESNVNYNGNCGLMKLQIGTTTENTNTNEISYDNVQKSIAGFNKHINKLKTEKVTEEELENAKLIFKNRILSIAETSSGKNISLSCNALGYYGELQDNQALKLVDEITTDDIFNAANYIFSNKPTYSIIATENTIKANENYFKTL